MTIHFRSSAVTATPTRQHGIINGSRQGLTEIAPLNNQNDSLSLHRSNTLDTLPEFRNIEPNKFQHTIAGLIAWIAKNPGPKGLPISLMSQYLPNIKRVQYESVDFKVSKPHEHYKLNGYWSPATNQNSDTCVILVHGFFGGPRDLITLAKGLNDKGVNVFLPELRAHGKRGNHRESTIGVLEGRDIVGALKFLDENFKNESEKVHLFGHSMGAVSIMTLPNAITEEQVPYVLSRVSSIMLDSPYASRASAINSRAQNVYENKWVTRLGLRKFTQGVCKAFVDKMESQAKVEHFPDEKANIYPAHVMNQYPKWREKLRLHIHGDNDTQTPFKDGERIERVFKDAGTNHTFVVLSGANHVGNENLVSKWRYPFKSPTALRGFMQEYLAEVLKVMNEAQVALIE